MKIQTLFEKALNKEYLSQEEGVFLFNKTPTTKLIYVANLIRNSLHPNKKVTWIIDRNLNTTNVCIANCKFCNFFRVPGHPESYITSMDEYREKIKETIKYGGNQLLLQGGHHPKLGLKFYTDTFKNIKSEFPNIKLHALGPPEVVHISQLENMSYKEVLSKLISSGLDSLPGAGAEILNDRVRKLISQGKCSSQEWLDVMEDAHQLNLTTSATMMFGHIETIEERIEHLIKIRTTQDKKPKKTKGFISFIPWPFMDSGTILNKVKGIKNTVSSEEYIRTIALSRILLPNIKNIQASWLTVGKKTAQVCLQSGANDFGSIMIEENVVSAAGAPHRFTAEGIQKAIIDAGFIPRLRNQEYEEIPLPKNIKNQKIISN